MENTFYLEIITPDRQFYTGPATNLTMPALDGEYGVQPGHEPVVTALRPGTVRFQADGTPHKVVVSDGFAEIMPDYCILLVSSAERPDEISSLQSSSGPCYGTPEGYPLTPLFNRLPQCDQMEHRSRRFRRCLR